MKKITILAALLMTACLGSKEDYSFKPEEFAKGDKAYVYISAKNDVKSSEFKVEEYFTFKNNKGKKVKLSQPGEKGTGYMIPAGKYTSVEFSLYGGRQYGNATKYINLPLDSMKGEFEVGPGEVAYLGHIDTKIIKVERNAFEKVFNRPIGEKDITYTSVVEDKFDELDKAAIEKTTGRKIAKRLMKWEAPKAKD